MGKMGKSIKKLFVVKQVGKGLCKTKILVRLHQRLTPAIHFILYREEELAVPGTEPTTS